ncbi:phenazine biosynthesis-like domain-containing protein 1 [Haliotis rufescens]|uniref:phenazine biosynthesis-like domain-containing protein 1 n=1 Tax=Haliotis rufescens TaxID=6454 RepID=UPI00201F996C|nr:phenazine biosynthesis-like domain-containing protein 1 [Haliotis rufescens]
MSELPIYFVDAFTKTAFSGNPAAVCLASINNANLTDKQMQKVAIETNMPATGFIFSDGDDESFKTRSRFGLRFFTSKTDINLCGHATLGSTAVLFKKLGSRIKVFNNKYLQQPIHAVKGVVVHSSLIQDVEYSSTTNSLLVRLSDCCSRSELGSLQPQVPRMVESERTGKVRGVIITLRGSQSNGAVDAEGRGYDFASRYFAPWVGIPEDHVTWKHIAVSRRGSAHTELASYWSLQLEKRELYARQCSPRGGDIHLRVAGERVHLAGDAAIIMTGTLEI